LVQHPASRLLSDVAGAAGSPVVHDVPVILLKASLVVFMTGNLLGMGLSLRPRDALAGLRDVRFVVLTLGVGFALCPALAWALARLVPMERPYAVGLILLGVTPGAPFLPMVVDRARGDMGYAAAVMLLTSLVTVAYMPLVVPLLLPGFSAEPWTIARPLLLLVLLPLAVGVVMRRAAPAVAARVYPIVKAATSLDTIAMLALCAVVYGRGFVAAAGSYAIAAQALFLIVVTLASWALGAGLPDERRGVLVLGMSTRNLGAAFAPLFALPAVDERAIVMVALGVPLTVLCSFAVAALLGRRAGSPGDARGVPGAGKTIVGAAARAKVTQ